jgi:cellobiose-specific phosphotransferase system component IIC
MDIVTYCVRACIQLIKEALIPSIDTVLKNLLDNLQQPLLTLTRIWQGKLESLSKLLWFLEVHQDIIFDTS